MAEFESRRRGKKRGTCFGYARFVYGFSSESTSLCMRRLSGYNVIFDEIEIVRNLDLFSKQVEKPC
jgi:hypothetical protein